MAQSATFWYSPEIKLGVGGKWSCLNVYGKDNGEMICWLQISKAGILARGGPKGRKIGEFTWRNLVQALKEYNSV